METKGSQSEIDHWCKGHRLSFGEREGVCRGYGGFAQQEGAFIPRFMITEKRFINKAESILGSFRPERIRIEACRSGKRFDTRNQAQDRGGN